MTGTLMWTRKSLGPSGLVQTVYENQEVQPLFLSTGRYQLTNTVSAEGLLQSTLRIANLQRTDIAEYSCVWGGSSLSGGFILDVIGECLVRELSY